MTTIEDQLYNKRGTPFSSRAESIEAMRLLMGMDDKGKEMVPLPRPAVANVHGMGPLLLSDIPSTSSHGVCVGIDEAGRGSVLGPMVYGAAFWNSSVSVPKGFNDSKQLTDAVRADLLEQLFQCPDIGFCARIFPACEISRNMLRAGAPYNLNQMSHDAAMDMIQAILDAGVTIQTCFIDTVGNPEIYKRKLERRFPQLEFVVESKADAKYPTCSAASVVAKVLRDRVLDSWQFTEPSLGDVVTKDFASGYPSDPKCKEWMTQNLKDPVFGWTDLVRFSWGPAKKTLLENDTAVEVVFQADDDDEEEDAFVAAGRKRQQEQMSNFLKQGRKDLRFPYFERTNLKTVTNLF